MKSRFLTSSLLLLLLGFAVYSCKTTHHATSDASIEELMKMMTGSFNSAQQAAADSSYFNISLHMYPIWENRAGHWLYVEQALNEMQEKPYRQRIYQVEQTEDQTFKTTVYATFKTTVYTLTNPDEAIGKWKTPGWFDRFDESMLEEREGCGVHLIKTALGSYQGSTKKGECKSSLRGASYATSEVIISEGEIYSWDQGFDEHDKQVWGATEGGYVFRKIN